MAEDEHIATGTDEDQNARQSDVRRTRGIRFSDLEWEEVKKAAEKHGVPAAEFVRDTVLDLARSRTGATSAALPPGLAALIESAYRGVYILTTLKREEMIREGRAEELDEIVQAARNAQADTLNEASE